MSSNESSALLDEVSRIMRLKHYSIHTERTYRDWIRQFVKFHRMSERNDLFVDSEAKIEAFLSYLASDRRVAAATQNQAMNALVFLYKQITVRSGKGEKDRVTTFSAKMIPLLQIHLAKVKLIHDKDLAEGFGAVYLPFALAKKYPNAEKTWGMAICFSGAIVVRRSDNRRKTASSYRSILDQ
ncbi:MAG: phage integrase N-terminal SAM-like domain-containing protein [Gammaproteobacteria bacterium]